MTAGSERAPSPFIRAVGLAAAACAFLIPVACVLWNLDAAVWIGRAFLTEQYLALILALVFAVAFADLWLERPDLIHPRVLYLVAAAVGATTLLYVSYDYVALLSQVAYRPLSLTIVGTVTVALLLEGVRRKAGWTLFALVMVFLVYALLAHLVPGPLVGREMTYVRLVQYVGFDPSAVYATPLAVGAIVVVLFVYFGKVLFLAGGGAFFTDLALALTGRTRGGSAKIAVVGSALFGSISGSAVSNVVTTGVVTIPLMRRGGYTAVNAGAIEAIASTGGQLAPPIMGAAAFLMAEFLEIPYLSVVAAAAIPALIYYVALFIQVDLMAARDGIAAADEDIRPVVAVLRDGWHLLIPFAALFAGLFWQRADPEEAAMLAAAAIVAVGTLRPYRGHRVSFSGLVEATVDTGRSVVGLILIVAAAGMVIGVLNATGLGFALTLMLVGAIGENAALILAVSALICIILGMGMPTSGVYVLLAALVAPAIVETGVEPIAAHLFILYFGMMSMITPPIALAAFAAATVSDAPPMRTGFAAVRIGWAAFLLPFLFVASPSLLLEAPAWETARDLALALLGVLSISAAVVGQFGDRLSPPVRLALAVAGLAALPVAAGDAGYQIVHLAAAAAAALALAALLFKARRARLAT